MRSVLLSTLGDNGEPHSGYTPFIFDNEADFDHHIIIFVSQLALHTRDLLTNGKVSAMLIADESVSEQIFARARVSYQCQAEVISSQSEQYELLLNAMQDIHGKMIGLLRTLPDFVLFRLKPSQGQFVMGFGQAFKLSGAKIDQFELSRKA
ncbi:MAG: putative heme iron utilization protein [Granulosicoccus sp.]|jgi:putative heme iron utilization protein